jgi:MerR family transcriptional regulator, light-induced transcriptional regulator
LNKFTISELSRFSGIKQHTIRIWEQRYNALKPNRSEGNTRYYVNSQLRRLLNIVSLKDFDYKVSELCLMHDEKLFRLVADFQNKTSLNGPAEYFISQLIRAGMSYDESFFEEIISHCMLPFGTKDAYLRVIYPMLVRPGVMWTSDELPPAHEHFISNLLRQKILTAIDLLPPRTRGANTWLLFLPEDEFHEMGLLFSYYIIRHWGCRCIYLGSNLPFDSLLKATAHTQADKMLFFFVRNGFPERKQAYLDRIGRSLKSRKIFVAASPTAFVSWKKRRIFIG